jgi:hypothetical protein
MSAAVICQIIDTPGDSTSDGGGEFAEIRSLTPCVRDVSSSLRQGTGDWNCECSDKDTPNWARGLSV